MSAEPTLPVSQPILSPEQFRDDWEAALKRGDRCDEAAFVLAYALYYAAERDRELQQARGGRDSLLAECQKLQDIVKAGDAESETVQSALREAREEIARLNRELHEANMQIETLEAQSQSDG